MIKDHTKESRNIVILNRGANFIGSETETAPLSYAKHNVKEILDVSYKIAPSFL